MNVDSTARCSWRLLFGVLLVALVINLGLAVALGLGKPMESDSFYFLAIAKSVAQGNGYILREGFWPDTPTMSRAPGWPFVIALVLRLIPAAAPDALVRVLACGLNALAAMLVAGLAWRLFGRRWLMVAAGLAYALYPVALYEAYEGTSEILFIVLVLGGVQAWISSGWRRWAGVFLLGCAALIRPNFITWIGFAGIAWAWQWLCGQRGCVRQGGESTHPGLRPPLQGGEQEFGSSSLGSPLLGGGRGGLRSLAAPLLAAALFLLPSLLWAARNYRVCGHFPVLSTLRGQTFYGGNNSVVSDSLEWWGYWVFPNSIPGEPTMYALSRTSSEYEVDTYYFGRGKSWVQTHKAAMPRLMLGKLIRAYVPIPWKPSLRSWGVAAVRLTLYGAAALGLLLSWRYVCSRFKLALGAMACTNLLTVLAFWGCARFAFELDPFLIPFALLGLDGVTRSTPLSLEEQRLAV